jgi:proteasome lid subunit RPN8/RPN11
MRVYRADGSCVGQVATPVDWEPAIESAWFDGVRRGALATTDGTWSSVVRPLWQPENGEPYVRGFRVTIPSDERDGISEDFTIAYMKPVARRILSDLVEDGHLEKDETVRYQFVAFFDEAHAKAGPSSPCTTREVVPALSIRMSTFADVAGGGGNGNLHKGDEPVALAGTARGETADMPIVVPQTILDQTRDLAQSARPNETGGILIGYLHRDTESNELFAEITGQIPAAHTTGDVDRLSFTPETWAAARRALDLRNRQEIYLGWWHSHPVREWCRDCPKEKRAACALARGFMSADDRQLHRVAFPRAFTCALVVSDVDDDNVAHALFGWRRGVLERRGFHVSGRANVVHVPESSARTEEHESMETQWHELEQEGGDHAKECASNDGRRRPGRDAAS